MDIPLDRLYLSIADSVRSHVLTRSKRFDMKAVRCQTANNICVVVLRVLTFSFTRDDILGIYYMMIGESAYSGRRWLSLFDLGHANTGLRCYGATSCDMNVRHARWYTNSLGITRAMLS